MTDFKEILRMIPKSGPWFSEPIMRRRKTKVSVRGRRYNLRRTCLALAGTCLFVAAASAATDPVGEWMVTKGYARIRIENCGGVLWGAVVWEQTTGVDTKNPDTTKRGRPTLGMPVLLDMKPTGANKWVGQIYNSEDGQTYASNISIGPQDVLQVRGCVLGILCGGEDWTRVVDPSLPPGSPGGPPLAPPPAAGGPSRPSTSGTAPGRPPASGSSMARPGAPAAPGNAGAPAAPIDYETASAADFCSAILNNSGAPH
jgi:uncharacterized protein (DUF2147 family)